MADTLLDEFRLQSGEIAKTRFKRCGEFTDRLQGLGVHERVARRLMTLAAKFAKTDSKSVLIAAAGSQSKLLELAILDDDDLDLIALGGTVKGLSLDSIDAMSARELREKLRDAEAELKVSQAAREKQRTRIDKLQAAQVRFAGLPPDDVLASMQDEAMSIMREARGAIDGRLRQAVRAIQNHGTESNEHDRFLAGLVAEIQHALTALREEAGLTDVAEGDLPGWLQGDEVAEAAAKARKGKGRQS